jgi:hypothetical protein
MHRLVFERGVERLGAPHRRPILEQFRLCQRAHDGIVGACTECQDFVARGPSGVGAAARYRRVSAVRIDPSLEKLFHAFVDRRMAESAAQKREDAECRQMPFVKHDRIAQRDRPGVVRGRVDEIKNGARAPPVGHIPVYERRSVDR